MASKKKLEYTKNEVQEYLKNLKNYTLIQSTNQLNPLKFGFAKLGFNSGIFGWNWDIYQKMLSNGKIIIWINGLRNFLNSSIDYTNKEDLKNKIKELTKEN